MSEQLVVLEKPFVLEAMLKKEMMACWKVSLYQLNKMLEKINAEIGEPVGGRYQPPQLQIFVRHYGVPGMAIRMAS